MSHILRSPRVLLKQIIINNLIEQRVSPLAVRSSRAYLGDQAYLTKLAYFGLHPSYGRVVRCRLVPLINSSYRKPDYTMKEHLFAISFWLFVGWYSVFAVIDELEQTMCPHCHIRINWFKTFRDAFTLEFL